MESKEYKENKSRLFKKILKNFIQNENFKLQFQNLVVFLTYAIGGSRQHNNI